MFCELTWRESNLYFVGLGQGDLGFEDPLLSCLFPGDSAVMASGPRGAFGSTIGFSSLERGSQVVRVVTLGFSTWNRMRPANAVFD